MTEQERAAELADEIEKPISFVRITRDEPFGRISLHLDAEQTAALVAALRAFAKGGNEEPSR